MRAYLIARVDVKDWDLYRRYTDVTPGIVAQYQGRFVVRGGAVTSLEGETESRRIVIIEFPSRLQAEAFYHSPEYTKARRLRMEASTGQFLIVDGA